jgi:hypothetical protein
MDFAVGDEVPGRSRFGGWEPGRISGQVGDYDTWYVTAGPGQTYLSQGRELRPAVRNLPKPSTE